MASEALDTQISKAVFAARLLERARHSDGRWTMAWGPHEVEVEREITDSGISFRARFPEHCYIVPPEPTLTLLHNGEVVAVRPMSDHPGDGAFVVVWRLAPEVEPASV